MTNANSALALPAPLRTTALADAGLGQLARVMTPYAKGLPLLRHGGKVFEVASDRIRVSGLEKRVCLGSCVQFETETERWIGEVIGIQANGCLIKSYSNTGRLGLGMSAWLREDIVIRPDRKWLGRIVNALGEPIDGGGGIVNGAVAYDIDREPASPMTLNRIDRPIKTGVRVMDLFTPICAGQRIGIFAGSGVGKSTMVSMLTRSANFQTIVVALVAERGREVREFIEDVLGPNLCRAVVVVASSAESPMMRKLSAKTAVTVAEYFRDQGDDVLMVVDSITRYAHALREVALAAGEPPVARGYTPSVFAELPRLLERAGPGTLGTGSITGVFSVLVDGEDHNEPVADTVRGILDGHIVLERSIAEQGRYPAFNPLTSISRLANLAWTREQALLIQQLKAMISHFEETRDLRSMGAYKPGADANLDQAIALTPAVYRLLTQSPGDKPSTDVFAELSAALMPKPEPAAANPPRKSAAAT